MIVLVGERDTVQSASVWAYDNDSNLLWTYDTNGNTTKVVLDASNNIYVTGARADNGDGNGDRLVWKISPTGEYQGGYDIATSGVGVDIVLDSLGRIIVSVSSAVSNKNMFRIAADLASEEAFGQNEGAGGLAADSDNNIIAVSGLGNYAVYKYDANTLTEIWHKYPDSEQNCTGLTVLSNDDIIAACSNSKIFRLPSDGAGGEIAYTWKYTADAGGLYRVKVDSNDLIYVCRYNDATGSNKRFYCLDSDGNEQWTITTDGGDLEDIFITGSDIPYICGDVVQNINLFKVDIVNYLLMKVLGTQGKKNLLGLCGILDVDLEEINRFDYHVTGESSAGPQIGGDNAWEAQTFTASDDYTIKSVKLKLYRSGSPGNLTVSIQGVDENDHPDGNDLCSGILDGNSITDNGSGVWYEISLGSGCGLSNGIMHAIVVRALDAPYLNYVKWREQAAGDGYADGANESTVDGGESWTTETTTDKMFETYGCIPPEITDQSDDTTIEVGKQINLFVTATGNPAPTYQWYQNGMLISGEIDATLSFYVESSGTYKCKVTNVGGTVWSNDIIVTVVGNPYINRLFSLFIDANRED